MSESRNGEREAGWYWVKHIDHWHPDYWEVQHFDGTRWEFADGPPEVIGPRIPEPNDAESLPQ